MHIHILGICGTFMGGLACLAREQGHKVTGSDQNIYPPMSTYLEEKSIGIEQGYAPSHLKPRPDCVVIGNALSRGNPCVEAVLNEKIPFCSGPQWLASHVLAHKRVIAVAGTHGKTTTTSMIAWILDNESLSPGFLIGGVPCNFDRSARIGQSDLFVVEADEYDSAFFDKRSKFLHYHPDTLVLNNLEFDHGDIFSDLEEIKTQFKILLRTVPAKGAVIVNHQDDHLNAVLKAGCWSNIIRFGTNGATWQAKCLNPTGQQFEVWHKDESKGVVDWDLMGQHNVQNGLAALAACHELGVPVRHAIRSLNSFQSVKRRMQKIAEIHDVHVYDDFAHHPTAIALSLNALEQRAGKENVVGLVDLGSNSMKSGAHQDALFRVLQNSPKCYVYQNPNVKWDVKQRLKELAHVQVFSCALDLVKTVLKECVSKQHILLMSNGRFDNVSEDLVQGLNQKFST